MGCKPVVFVNLTLLPQRAKITDEIPEAAEDYSKEFSKLSSKTENEKVHIF